MLARNLGLSFVAVVLLALLAAAASKADVASLLTVLPYAAFILFLGGFVYRVGKWAMSPVPFRIPTTCGQEKSLPWIQNNPLENPCCNASAVGRMAGEIFLFRSLFRNSAVKMIDGRPVYGSAKWLWFFGLMLHGAFLIVVLRHLRFFTEPILPFVNLLSAVDGFFEIGVPALYVSDAALLCALVFLFLRRVVLPQMLYISLFTDYFALLLIAGIAVTGLLIRHFFPVDLNAVKTLVAGWMSLKPAAPGGAGVIFYMHLSFVLVLLAWLPWSKLAHLGGIFMSPTRNLINNNRSEHHANPWNAEVLVHTYEEYEDEFRDKMKAAGLPVDKE